MTIKFTGSLVAIVTPMKKGKASIDEGAYKDLLEWHIDSGSDAIVVAGTTGESPTLSMKEHQTLISQTVRFINHRIPVIAGVGSNSTEEAVELTTQAFYDGADAGLSVVPYYNKPTQEGLYSHFSKIADSVEFPLILYDVPSRCVTTLEDETVAALALHSNIIGIKDATADVGRVSRLKKCLDDQANTFLQLSGDDKTALDYLFSGGDGVISVTANIAPKQMHDLVVAGRAGDKALAMSLNDCLRDFHHVQSLEANPIPVKAALAMMNKIENVLRLPLTPLSPQYEAVIQDALIKIKES